MQADAGPSHGILTSMVDYMAQEMAWLDKQIKYMSMHRNLLKQMIDHLGDVPSASSIPPEPVVVAPADN